MTGSFYGFGISAAVVVPLYSVLLAWLLRKAKKTTAKHYGCFVWILVCTFPIVFLLVWGLMPIYYLEPYSGRVVDADTGEPIVGAAVLVIFRFEAPSVAGTVGGYVDGREAKTDKNGEFKTEKELHFFSGKGGTPFGIVTAWKPGYKKAEAWWSNWQNEWWDLSENTRIGPPPYHVYKLKKLETRKKQRDNLPSAIYIKGVDRERFRYFMTLLNAERVRIGLEPYDKYFNTR